MRAIRSPLSFRGRAAEPGTHNRYLPGIWGWMGHIAFTSIVVAMGSGFGLWPPRNDSGAMHDERGIQC
jgi:hypothetical protein